MPGGPCIRRDRMRTRLPYLLALISVAPALENLLSGRPGFISDPTMDESKNGIILAHCMGTPRMEGPDKPVHLISCARLWNDRKASSLRLECDWARE